MIKTHQSFPLALANATRVQLRLMTADPTRTSALAPRIRPSPPPRSVRWPKTLKRLQKSRLAGSSPSTYNDLDARTHEVQRQRGSFAWLTLDVDTNNLSLEAVDASLSHVIGEACRIIYSTRSATEENKKWRALVPLANKIDGSDFSDTQNAFFDLLEEASEGALTPDRALARPAQLVYLPNHGDFYQVKLDKLEALALSPDHAIIQHRDAKQKALALGAWSLEL